MYWHSTQVHVSLKLQIRSSVEYDRNKDDHTRDDIDCVWILRYLWSLEDATSAEERLRCLRDYATWGTVLSEFKYVISMYLHYTEDYNDGKRALQKNKRVSEMQVPLAALREPSGGPEQAAKCAMILNIKRNIFLPMLHIPASWHFDISVIYPQWLHRVKFVTLYSSNVCEIVLYNR